MNMIKRAFSTATQNPPTRLVSRIDPRVLSNIQMPAEIKLNASLALTTTSKAELMQSTLDQLVQQNQTCKNWLRENRRLNGSMLAHEHQEKIPSGVGVVYISAGRNNTIVTLTDWQHKVVSTVAGGMCGLKGHNRGTSESGTRTGARMGEIALQKGLRDVFVVLKGFGSGRDAAFRSLMASGLTIHRIADKTPIAHGGCRPRKARRV